MIYGNNINVVNNYIYGFPDIHKSDTKLYICSETPTYNNWNDIFVNNIDIFKQYDKIMFDDGMEASDFNVVNNLLSLLKENNVTDVLYLDAGLNNSFKFKTVYSPALIHYHDNDFVKVKDRKHLYVSLARLISSRFQRLFFTHELYKNKLLCDGIVTCGCAEEDITHHGLDLFDEDFQNIIPLCYDGIVDRNAVSTNYMTIGKECLINVVQESSFETIQSINYPSIYFNGGVSWNRPFFTEKTAKAFNAGQIPLFLTVSGYVNILKTMGFDVFDDIVDHSYDNELIPDNRILMVVKELSRLKEIGIENLKNIYNLEDRLLYNKNHMKTLHNQMHIRYMLMINSWFFSKNNKKLI